ncbi:MAG: IS1595 family transposase [Methylocella sp.]
MTPVELSNPIYHDEEAARAHLEAVRWPDGPICPHCGVIKEGIRPVLGNSMGPGWYYCTSCKDKFTVRMGAIYERSHLPLHKWLLAFRLMASSKKGFSAHQLSRTLNVQYKTAWFVAHRIREAMADHDPEPFGGKGKVVEVDETFQGPSDDVFVNRKGWQKKRGTASKRKVISLVERGGRAKSVKVEELTAETVKIVLCNNIVLDSTLNTDEARYYNELGRSFYKHESVNHGRGEYKRGEVCTNSVEGFFSIFKRGMIGVYQHCGEQHLQRYLHEFDFRYSNRSKLGIEDGERTTLAIKGAAGKRLTYRSLDGRDAA